MTVSTQTQAQTPSSPNLAAAAAVDALAVRVSGVVAGYPGVQAVAGVDVWLPAGQVSVLVGPNGCGKSTLLRTIARLHAPESGRITLEPANPGQTLPTKQQGDASKDSNANIQNDASKPNDANQPAPTLDVWQTKPKQVAQSLALLPQSPQAPAGLTVRGLVGFGRHPHQGLFRQWSEADGQAVAQALADTGLTDLADRPLEALSGGQRQRAWFAMALAQTTPVMLLDEPTSMLDLGHQIEVLSLAKQAAERGKTVLVVLHDLMAAARFADQLIAMQAGQIVAHGPPAEILTPELVQTLYGVQANILLAPCDQTPVVVPCLTPINA